MPSSSMFLGLLLSVIYPFIGQPNLLDLHWALKRKSSWGHIEEVNQEESRIPEYLKKKRIPFEILLEKVSTSFPSL